MEYGPEMTGPAPPQPPVGLPPPPQPAFAGKTPAAITSPALLNLIVLCD